MSNNVYLQAYSTKNEFLALSTVKLPLASFITYSVYKYCCAEQVTLKFVSVDKEKSNHELFLHCVENLEFIDETEVPWPAALCIFPVVLCKDTVITGLCAVARHICKYRSSNQSSFEHEEGLLGFRKSCLQAPNEVSIWTKFCEVDLIKTVQEILETECLENIPKNLIRLENHLSKPVKVHNVFKIARDIKKENLKSSNQGSKPADDGKKETIQKSREPKPRKWKSKTKKELEIDCSTKIEDLDICHQFAEGPFLTLADLILLPSYHILIKTFGEKVFESQLPLTFKWHTNISSLLETKMLTKLFDGLKTNLITIKDLTVPDTENVSLYKCDLKRHNPKKRLFTKEEDIETALSKLIAGMELTVGSNDFAKGIDWSTIPAGANPLAGHLPDERMARKSQQLENLVLAVLDIAEKGDLIVDFCSGSGHLGILIAHLLPECTVILLENKEQSLLRARKRVHDMGLKNVYFFQCNLDFFIGKFDIGIALHACGIASDLVLEKCLKANAKFVLCPCCYGSLHATDRLVYPRSNVFRNVPIDQYLCIGHAADQTHEDHPLMTRGARCMAIIDSDRARLAEEFGYKVSLSRLKPLTCTPKNNLLIGVPS